MEILKYFSISLIFILFLSGAPLAVAFGSGSSIILLFLMGIPLENLADIVFSSINSYPLLACPFFILAGHLILRSGGMKPLQHFMQAMFGHWTGGHAVASCVFAAFLGSISGSGSACLAILGTVIVPILVAAGYERAFSAGMCAMAAELGLLIPPSLYFIIFGSMNQISIADLFLGAIGPGIVSTFLMCIVAIIVSKRRAYPISSKASWQEKWVSLTKVLPILVMPIIVLGGIYSGLFSPTQAGAIAILYAACIGFFYYKGLNFAAFIESVSACIRVAAMIYFLIISAGFLTMMLAYIRIPQLISEWVASFEMSKLSFLLTIDALLLVMGFVFSSLPMIIVVLPLFLPTVVSLGIDPVYYGIIGVMLSLIGEMTPPFGPMLWFAVPICNVKMGQIAKESIPFIGSWVLCLLLLTIFPEIAMFLIDFFK